MIRRLSASGAMPNDAATASFSATARIVRPAGERTRFSASRIAAMQASHASGKTARSVPSSRPSTLSGGMPESPSWPPVSPFISTVATWTMMPNASVAIARWWPRRRKTSQPMPQATAVVATTANASASQGFRPSDFARIALAYAPSPTNAACPSEIWPV